MKTFALALLALGLAGGLVFIGAFALGGSALDESRCDVATVRLYGELYSFVGKDDDAAPVQDPFYQELPSDTENLRTFVSSADEIVRELEAAAADESIRAVIVEVDSPGGSPYAGDAIRAELERLGKPSVAVIKEYGASAAYWAAVGADRIIASPVSDVGSIGVSGSFVDYSLYNEQSGYTYVELTSAPYKDAGNPEKGITFEDYSYLQGSVEELHEMFVDAVAESRGLEREAVLALADGRSFYGREALDLGLIDELGGLREARTYLETQIDAPVSVCN